MARKGKVLEFRRSRQARRLPPGPPRKSKFRLRGAHRLGILSVRGLLVSLIVVPVAFLGSIAVGENLVIPKEINYLPTIARPPATEAVVKAAASAEDMALPAIVLNWVDGDSGTIDGREFRLYGVDAPEGSPHRAECAKEQRLSSKARQAARKLTNGAEVKIHMSHGIDKYDRELLTLRANGRDVASALVAKGHLKRWNYEAGQSKPNWCGS